MAISARGKFLFAGEEKFHLCGVTYGPFRPDPQTGEQYTRAAVDRDFAHMGGAGINTVRLYTVPPRWLLDAAADAGLRVMVGLPWEQHVAFLEDARRAADIEARVREGVRACAGHPAVLCYTVGNEIPASIVRWHGRRRIERFIERLYGAAKAEDPQALVTYVNYPSTEYLALPCVDFLCFNVYLEDEERLDAYLARLQNIADDRPLVLAEIGLDSRRNGEEAQAQAIDWQLRSAFEGGCAGAVLFAWTDEWHRGGYDIDDWDFGLTTRDRQPKPALAAACAAFAEAPFGARRWPSASVVVCTYNGAATLDGCLDGLARLDYPDYEVLVVSDGSTDASAAIARAHGVRLIETGNRGLSSARNTGLEASRGEIVAYLDDDARPDEHWLMHLAHAFATGGHAVVGGPNVPFPGDGLVADCVAQAPGGPTHVLLSDRVAEHVPGCNMAFRRDRLEAIGGFDHRFRIAGDDVDVCWRIQERGWTVGFSSAAFVWHHRRRSVRAYLRQQRGYGEAEALLERKWPSKYSAAGHPRWHGRLYGNGGAADHGTRRWRVYYGTWGSGLFQSLYKPSGGWLGTLVLTPEWYLAIGALAAVGALASLWWPLLLAVVLFATAMGALVLDAGRSAWRASFRHAGTRPGSRLRLRLLTAALYVLQPLARLRGRMRQGLTLWRRPYPHGFAPPWPRSVTVWSETWQPAEHRLGAIESSLQDASAMTQRGGDFDRWDLEICGGLLGSARLRMAIEEHGAGRQFVRVRVWPRASATARAFVATAAALAAGAAMSAAWTAAVALGALAVALSLRSMYECGAAEAGVVRALGPRPRTLPARAVGGVRRRPALPAALVIVLILSLVLVLGAAGDRDGHRAAAAVVHHHRHHGAVRG